MRQSTIPNVPAYVRTANTRVSRHMPVQAEEGLQMFVSAAPHLTSEVLALVFGWPHDREAARILDSFASEIETAINERAFKGLLFEVAVYAGIEDRNVWTYDVRLVREGDTAQEALERDYLVKHMRGPTIGPAGPDPSRYSYDVNKSYFVFVTKNEEDGSFETHKISDSIALRNLAASNVINTLGVEAAEIREGERAVRGYRHAIARVKQSKADELVKLQFENIANARIKLEHDLMEARAKLRKAEHLKRSAARFAQWSKMTSIAGKTIKLGADIFDGAGAPGSTFGEWKEEYGPQLNLEFDFDAELDLVPALKTQVQQLQKDAIRYDRILL